MASPVEPAKQAFAYLFSHRNGSKDRLIARWLFLRCLGLIYFSAFFALAFQILGLVGPRGILPASDYLIALQKAGMERFWYAPTLLWFSSGDTALNMLCWVGIAASVCVVLNLAPRLMLGICFLCFLSFSSAAQDFAAYQSDGMLLEAGFISLFLAPKGMRPGWGTNDPPSRAAVFLLLWEWLRIYFQSGVVKLASGDPTWRNLTAMYEYYQNGPLPTWVGWYLQHLPNWFHVATAGATLVMELLLVWMGFLPGRWRVICFCTVTVWQIGVISTANYTFLNYLVLILAFLLLDDRFLLRFVPARWRGSLDHAQLPIESPDRISLKLVPEAFLLSWLFYAATVPMFLMFWRHAPLPLLPVAVLEPFRIANQYGLFAVMTPHRYEIEFQGSPDGQQWVAYPFRYKPQDPRSRPRIYAPYQPRFDWNVWFASLGRWQEYPIVPRTEELLLENDRDVIALFAGNPFRDAPPRFVRAVLWQYWFSTPEQKRSQGIWWRRELLGNYAPTLTRTADGKLGVMQNSIPKGNSAP